MSNPGDDNDERTLERLEQEKESLESHPHDGYADAARVARLESEIEMVEERISREKQRAEHGEG